MIKAGILHPQAQTTLWHEWKYEHLLRFIYFDIIQTLSNVFTYLNYNAWKKEFKETAVYSEALSERKAGA